jgi:hypothetical protein
MFAFPRSALAVVLPLALLFAVVLWSNRGAPGSVRPVPVQASGEAQPAGADVLAANLPSR